MAAAIRGLKFEHLGRLDPPTIFQLYRLFLGPLVLSGRLW